jgi:uncharacterized protein YigE (DUF2233 family)
MHARVKVTIVLLLFALMYSPHSGEGQPGLAVKAFFVKYAGKSFVVVKIDPSIADIKLFWRGPDGRPYNTIMNLDSWLAKGRIHLAAAINAGIFEGDQSSLQPLGLHVEEGLLIRPLNTREGIGNFYLKPNGVFYVKARVAKIVPSEDFKANAEGLSLATQSGPLLINKGKIHPRFLKDSQSRNARAGVGTDPTGIVYWVHSRDVVNFYEFALFFRDGLKCDNALYLDGIISRIYAPPVAPMFQQEKPPLAGILAVVRRK